MRTARLPHGTTLDVPLYAFVSCRVEFARVLVTAGVWGVFSQQAHHTQ